MKSPKSRQHKEKKQSGFRHAKHLNNKFYNSTAWQNTRQAYFREYQQRLYNELPSGSWKLRSGETIEVSPDQATYILSLIWLPCEKCLELYLAEAYDKVSTGHEVDHIIPVNPNNALISQGYGLPFDFNNLQLLCKRHHAKKSQREN